RRAGAARGAAGADLAEAVRVADRSDVGELRFRVPAGGGAVEARGVGDGGLAAAEAVAVDAGPPGRGQDALGHRLGGAGRGVRLLGGVLPPGGAVARDAARRGRAADTSQ